MVSCAALYAISARLALARNEPDLPFGGINIIVAGDFAQLPPVGSPSLFCGDRLQVPDAIQPKITIGKQKNAIGKIIWQQFTTVVILKQNMRQTKTSEADENLRTCLANMRFGACTPSDLEYLRTRTISRRSGHPTFEDPRFRNVSIITALNAQKDKINEIGCQKFADETNQPLVHFYSEDTLTENAASESRKPQRVRKREVLKVKRKLSTHRQQQLWDAYPCSTSEHIPGKLSLCVGMPIMIHHNDATELCITKGQEGTVVGWQESLGSQDQTILDTLFVELIKPPRPIRVPGLPMNVVALTHGTKKLWCQLPDDLVVQVSREQVLVLPNFAMTDYASQGKTREFNVIDLNNCKTVPSSGWVNPSMSLREVGLIRIKRIKQKS
ncbi:hypothetical protein DFH08DRAFT_704057 [Mycena albidolilacea]|uniref:ATP-dependent DNA helicase n=1 Tax=Mycena albidolilacea TaxID=1033008 RepID=A0AAD6ZVQ9_9AGAR|nr:hypothetical protein DFH08DRAFT_704057 [Mycena albidolilacea]